jgi:flavodoxin
MMVQVVYDSAFGNTEQIAMAIGAAFGTQHDVKVLRMGESATKQMEETDLLIVGSPTQGWRPLASVQGFLEGIPDDGLKNTNVAAFDTRIAGREAGTGARLVARLGGFAATRIAEALKKKGGNLIVSPEGFAVTGQKGPLAQGELIRATDWAKSVMAALDRNVL